MLLHPLSISQTLIAILLLLPIWSFAAEPVDVPAPAASIQSPAPSPSRAELNAMVDHTAQTHGLDRDLVHALIRAESAYNPQAVSPAGALGLMQVMPATAADYGVNRAEALFEPATNLNTGMRHFKRLLNKYNNIGAAVMAYNAGEGALERGGGVVSYAETQRYTHQVLLAYLKSKGIAPYSPDARAATGIDLKPEMATASVPASRRSSAGIAGVAKPPAAPDPLQTFEPEPDLRWQPTFKQPELKTALRAQLAAKPRLPAAPELNVAALRMRIPEPQYLLQPSSRGFQRRQPPRQIAD
ncbi:lytic transglycosylase domain-containing protein [Chromatium okenii]|nr:lytic transglycosylase domain-containing protein [Chromatium okenii]